jgi:hypothetical protein
MALKPKPEMLLTVLILWAFERYLRGDRRAYLVAFLATMVRYEGILAIGAFFLADIFFGRNKGKSFFLALLSSMFLIAWSLFQGSGDPGSNYGDYFTGYSFNWHFIYMFASELLGFLPITWFKVWAVLGSLLFVAGVISLWLRDARATLALAAYLAAFIVLHVIWPFSGPDYLVMAAWVALIFLVHGISHLYRWVRDHLRHSVWLQLCRDRRWPCFLPAVLVLFLTVSALLLMRSPYPQYRPSWVWMIAIALPLLFYHWPRHKVRSIAAFCMVLSVMLFLVYHINSRTKGDLFELYYAKAEFRSVGEWFEKQYAPGQRMLVSQPNIVAYYTKLKPEQDFVRLVDAPVLPPSELHAWLRSEGISHVAWLSYNLMAEQKTAWSEWVNTNRRLETIAFLGKGVDVPGFVLVESIQAGPRYAYIYRVEKLD